MRWCPLSPPQVDDAPGYASVLKAGSSGIGAAESMLIEYAPAPASDHGAAQLPTTTGLKTDDAAV